MYKRQPLLQPAFVREVLSRCRAEGIPTAVETNLSVPSELIEELLPLVGLWMCDLKLADDSRHRRWTGMSNARTVAVSYTHLDVYKRQLYGLRR